ncbi:hypothetical protein DACRYDRAFT_119736 [Dacryopinax primogenitus]|uniref:Serine hydrolase domain-containing protein n=1 Tax=Dacryopinax primogenitus (strain DJM 731) TaxID=1858805 RepID=M5FPA2_DACPD|nr:uncharacterized protein DACRYDRAFT_119736 [Dacryopinax primogenitus]EJT96918.1 hypothetical protein DACRYDRAFT_119736 [Dacryopinax primogenitus]
MRKLRVLALHGFGQNALRFQKAIGAIAKECAADVDFDSDRFNGIFGFSQGGIVASYLCSFLENRDAHPLFENCNHPPFKFVVLASGLLPIEPSLPPIMIRTPSLHVFGRNDTYIHNSDSHMLAAVFKRPRIEYHDGEHFVPTKLTWRQFFHDWMLAFRPETTVIPEAVADPVARCGSGELLSKL